jgi:uncharacterized protein
VCTRGKRAEARVRFYAELNDFLSPERRFRDSEWGFDVPGSVKDLIESLGVPHTEVDLILVNGESSDFSRIIGDGDYISVYPVFEGIDITPVLRVRPKPLREIRFVLDIHLGRLAAYLRMLGFDALYSNTAPDADLARISREERRILLTRDVGLLKRRDVTHGYYVRETPPRAQMLEVVRRFDLQRLIRPFERCLRCNALLRRAPKIEIAQLLPPRVAELHDDFRRCDTCGRVYWKGSHYQRMQEFLSRLV